VRGWPRASHLSRVDFAVFKGRFGEEPHIAVRLSEAFFAEIERKCV
jgi:hypothetical protein